MEAMQKIVQPLFAVDSIGSVILRGVIWCIVAVIIIMSVDKPDSEKSLKDLKSNLGFFMMFLLLSGGLIYLLFGFSKQG